MRALVTWALKIGKIFNEPCSPLTSPLLETFSQRPKVFAGNNVRRGHFGLRCERASKLLEQERYVRKMRFPTAQREAQKEAREALGFSITLLVEHGINITNYGCTKILTARSQQQFMPKTDHKIF